MRRRLLLAAVLGALGCARGGPSPELLAITRAPSASPADAVGPATYGSTGLRMVATGGGGFRVQLGQRWTVRLEVQDLIHWGGVSRINGCNATDLQTLDAQRAAGGITGAGVSGQCNVGAFQGTTSFGYDRSNDVSVAHAKVNEGGTDTLHVVGVYLGFGVEL